MDGIRHSFAPGEPIRVIPENGIALETFVYYSVYAEKDQGLRIVGEVFKVNDDDHDNVFLVKSE